VKIVIGSDHAGFELKEKIKQHLIERGLDVEDVGTEGRETVDYPVYAHRVGRAVVAGQSERGVVVCGTGIGVCIGANKVAGIRAALAYSEETARLASAHNDANVLCLGGRTMDHEEALRMLDIWLDTPFDGGRHARRVNMLEEDV